MLELVPHLPAQWHGLWERTLLERYGPGTLTNDLPAKVFWLQTEQWHADIRIPLDRPSFDGIASLEACNDKQLAFISGQEGFCGLTRVEGKICTWLRLFDLNPGTALDVARMEFSSDELILETGIAESYLEHWSLVEGSKPSIAAPNKPQLASGEIFLQSGQWAIHIVPRPDAPDAVDLFLDPAEHSRESLIWRASLCLTLYEKTELGWTARLSTFPWLEGTLIETKERAAECV